MKARLYLEGEALTWSCGGATTNFAFGDEGIARLRGWAAQYEAALKSGDMSGLGCEMRDWLGKDGAVTAWFSGAGVRELEIAVLDAGS